MKKNNIQKPKELLKINIITTILVIISNLLIFFFFESSKDKFTILSTYANGIIFFIYLLLFSSKVKRNILDLKKEALYINYPLNIWVFFIFLFLILIASTICLISVNKDAANITFIFTFFMSTISMLFPSIILLVFIYFAIPAIIIPSISIQKRKKDETNFFIMFLFVCFLIFCIYNGTNTFIKERNFELQNKYKSARLTISYSTDFLKI